MLDQGNAGRVLAVLDWELSTLGHPVADLAYSAMPYHMLGSPDGQGLQSLPEDLPEGMSEALSVRSPNRALIVSILCSLQQSRYARIS